MEKIGLLEDINKSKSNPDVRQKERSGQPLGIKSHGGKEEEKTAGKQVIKMINS